MTPLAVFILLFFLYSLVSGRMQRTIVTAPIVFTVAVMSVLVKLGPIGASRDMSARAR
jgi:hypothetical protein